jgi:DNA-binding MarR family transcriptional regulator
MAELYTRFDSVFFEKTRLSIVTLLHQDERLAFNALKERLDLSDGSLYTHLEKLIRGGYVLKERELVPSGSRTLYELTPRGREAFADYIAFLDDMLGRGETK